MLALERRDRRGRRDLLRAARRRAVCFQTLGLIWVGAAAVAIASRPRAARRASGSSRSRPSIYALWYLGWADSDANQLSFDNVATAPAFVLDGYASVALLAARARRGSRRGRDRRARLGPAAAGARRDRGRCPPGRPRPGPEVVLGRARGRPRVLVLDRDQRHLRALGDHLPLPVRRRDPDPDGGRRARPRLEAQLAGDRDRARRLARRDRRQRRGAARPTTRCSRPTSRSSGAASPALEIGRDTVDPGLLLDPDNAGFNFFTLVDAGSYLSAVDAFGSPAYSVDELAEAPKAARVSADRVTADALGSGRRRPARRAVAARRDPPARSLRSHRVRASSSAPRARARSCGCAATRPSRSRSSSARWPRARRWSSRFPVDGSSEPWELELGGTLVRCRVLSSVAAVVAAAQVVLEEDVEDDEQVAAAHLLDRELALPRGPVSPRDRDHREAVPADDRLQRDLDREVEVVGEQRLDRLDHLAPVGLEGVRGVVEAVAEEHPDEPVGEPVEHQLHPRVVVDRGRRGRSASRRRSRSPARAARGSGRGRAGSSEPSAIITATASPSKRSSPERTVNPKPRGWCERRQRTCGCSAAIASTRPAVPSTLASSTTRISCSIPAASSAVDRLPQRLRDRARLVVGGDHDGELHRAAPATPTTSLEILLDPGQDVGEHLPGALRAAASRCARTGASSRRRIAERRRGARRPRRRSRPRCRSARGRSRSSRAARGCTSRPPPTLPTKPLQRSGSASCWSISSTRSSTCSRSRTCLPVAAVADVGQRPPE